jgi:glycosyltransferase involved in cell wall biosynthesis
VGPGMTEERSNKISKNDNIYYLGPIYDTIELSKIYSLSSVSCIPGEVGLGVNEAFLFGLPIVTTYIRPTSEMKLLFSDGENGLLFENGNQEDLKEKLLRLLSDKELLEKFSKKAKKSFEEKGKIEYMFDGFLNSVNFVLKNE